MEDLTRETLQSIREDITERRDDVLKERFGELHPADIAEVLDRLEADEVQYLWKLIDLEERGDVLIELDDQQVDAALHRAAHRPSVVLLHVNDEPRLVRHLGCEGGELGLEAGVPKISDTSARLRAHIGVWAAKDKKIDALEWDGEKKNDWKLAKKKLIISHVLEHFHGNDPVEASVRGEVVHVGGQNGDIGQPTRPAPTFDEPPLRGRVGHGRDATMRITFGHPQGQRSPAAAEGCDRQAAIRMADADIQRRVGAHRMSDDMGFFDAEAIEHSHRVR